MVNRKLRQALLTKLKVTPQRISQRASALKRRVPMSTEQAWQVIAAQEGLDVSKYLDQESVDQTRQLLTHAQPSQEPPTAAVAAKPSRPSKSTASITITPDISINDPLISKAVAEDAKMMSEKVYPLAYLLENSTRAFVTRVLAGQYGKDWWDTKVSASIRGKVAERTNQENSTHWHGKRNAHPIYYTDTDHLRRIVDANWKDFDKFLPNKEFFTQRLAEINVSRRVIAHNNPLAAGDRKRLEVYFNDWQNHVTGIANSLP